MPALCVKQALLQGRWAGGLRLSREFHDPPAGPPQSSQVARVLCPAEALQGRRGKGAGLSWGLPGLWKEGSRAWADQALCG